MLRPLHNRAMVMKLNYTTKKLWTLCVAVLPLMFAVSCEKENSTPTNESSVIQGDPNNPGGDPTPQPTTTSLIPTTYPEKHVSEVVCQRLNWQTMEQESQTVTDYIWDGDLLHEIIITSTYSLGGEVETNRTVYRFTYDNDRVASVISLSSDENDELQEGYEVTYEYDANGRIVRHVSTDNETVTYTYPGNNQVNLTLSRGSGTYNYSLRWTADNLVQIGAEYVSINYTYTNNPNPFYFPIHFMISMDDRNRFTAGIAMPFWSSKCALTSSSNNYCEWQWTFGADGYPTELFETNNDDWKGSPIRNRYTFSYAN